MNDYKAPGLTLRQLQHFVAVAHASSITAAAKELHITQPALTESIRQVEQRLDCQLFERTSKRLVITPLGEAILPMAERVIHVSTNTLDDMYALVGQRSRTLHLGILPIMARRIFDVLACITEEMPDIKFEVNDFSNVMLLDELSRGKLDLAIGIREQEAHTHLHSDHLFDDEVAVMMPQNDPLADAAEITWKMLAHRQLVQLKQSRLDKILEQVDLEQGTQLAAHCLTAYTETLCELTRREHAIALVPRLYSGLLASEEWIIRPINSPLYPLEIALFSSNSHPHVPMFLECRRRLIELLRGDESASKPAKKNP